jgi:hypothetical protein
MLVGLGVLFLGYSTAYYGLSQLRGQNYGYLDLMLPGRWQKLSKGNAPKNDNGTDPAAIAPPPSVNQYGENAPPTYDGDTPGTYNPQGQALPA